MARLLLLVVGVLIACAAGARAGSEFLAEDNPIRQVVDGFHELESSIVKAVGNSRRAFSFARFAHRYGKSYESSEEIQRRFQVYSENLRMIRSHNKKGLSYTMAVNEFSDLTWDEFKKHRLGAAQNCSATTSGNHKLTAAVLPDSKDWRESGIVSPVKSQGGCGSCWTFSSTGALEAAYAQAFGKSISLSEQQLVDCAGAFNNFGCNGGLPSQAFEYIKYNGGLMTEEAYPYTGKDGVCKYSSENAAIQVLDSVNITLGAEDELKHAVAFVRPVSVAFEVVDGSDHTMVEFTLALLVAATQWMLTMLFLLLVTESKMAYHIGSSRIPGGLIGVTMAISKWSWARTCVALQPVHHTLLLLKRLSSFRLQYLSLITFDGYVAQEWITIY